MQSPLSAYDPELIDHPALEPEERGALATALRASDTSGAGVGCLVPALVLLGLAGWGALELTLWIADYSHWLSRLARGGIMCVVLPFLLMLRSGITAAGPGHVMKKDWRRPILFLRPSVADGPPSIERMHLLEPVPVRLGRAVEVSVKTLFEPWGPVVGIEGGVSDWMGPHRLPRSPEWQDLISALMKVCYAIVFVPGKLTGPIEYELRRSAQLVPPRRVIFYVGPDGCADQAYQELVEQLFPKVKVFLSGHPAVVAGDGTCVRATVDDLEHLLGRRLR